MEQQVEYSLIRTYQLLIQIIQSIGDLFQEKHFWYLKLSTETILLVP